MPVRIAALQMRSGPEPGPNLEALALGAHDAAAAGARYLLSPEVTVAFAPNREALARVAEPHDGNGALARVGEIARRHGLFLHLGSLAVALPDGRFANRSVLFGPGGEELARYDKIHLFDATLGNGGEYRESATYQAGDRAILSSAAGFALGLTICYDLRFPPLFSALARAGAQVIAVPSAFTVPTGRAHWEVLLRARAIETGAFVIAAAQGGLHPNGRATYGHSMVVSPWGEIVARLEGDAPGVLLADIDLDQVEEARRRIPALTHARPFELPTALPDPSQQLASPK